MFAKSLLVVLSCLVTFSVVSPAYAEDLVSAYMAAISFDPSYNAVKYEKAADENISGQGRALLLPSVFLGGSMSRTETDSDYYGDYTTKSLSISLNQPIFDAQRFFSWKQSKINAYKGMLKLRAAELDLAYRLTSAYMNVLKAQNQVHLRKAEADAARAYYLSARRLRESGEGTVTDVYTAEARMKIVEASVVAAQNELKSAQNVLASITGRPIAVLRLRQDIPLQRPNPASVEEWIAIAKDKNPSIMLAKKDLEYVNAELRKRQFEYAPTVNLGASSSKVEKDLITYSRTSDITVSSVGLNLRFPIFEGGVTQARVAEYKNRVAQYNKILDSTITSVTTKVYNTFNTVNNLIEQINALKLAVNSAEVALESTKRSYQGGIRSMNDVISATTEYYSALRNLSDAYCDYVINVIALKAFSGVLTGDDISAVNQWLEK